VLQRLVKLIRHKWSLVRILIRADSGFCRDALMSWCEANGVKYLFGMAKSRRGGTTSKRPKQAHGPGADNWP
jgi:hypothetical protein